MLGARVSWSVQQSAESADRPSGAPRSRGQGPRAPDAAPGLVATWSGVVACAPCGGVPERPKGADCKSAGSRLRRFESFPLHQVSNARHCAGIAQRLEHRPSKPRVAGSNPVSRSILRPVNLSPERNSSLPLRGRRILRNDPGRRRKPGFFRRFALTAGAPGPRFPDSRDTPRRPSIEEVAFGVVCLFHTHPGLHEPSRIGRSSLLTFRIRATLSAGMVAVVRAHVAQSVEHLHGKEKVIGSIPIVGSICMRKEPPKQVIRRPAGA